VLDSPNYVVEGALRPTGLCIPACTDDATCEQVFYEGSTCDTATGVCG
jgi:hypothetical protein